MKPVQRALALGRSVSFYPNTTLYLIASVTIVASFAGTIGLGQALTIISVSFVALLTMALRREALHEINLVHELVNSQHDELVARVAELTKTLHTAGVAVPADPKGKT